MKKNMNHNIEENILSEVIQLGLEFSKIKDVDILLETILTKARKLTNADAGSIYLREGNQLKFSYAQNETVEKKNFKNKKLPYTTYSIIINSESIAGYVAETGKILNIPDAYLISKENEYNFNSDYDKLMDYKTKSVLTVPLKSIDNEVIGIFQLINKKDENENISSFNEKEISIIEHFANVASSALERAKLTRDIILRMINMAELRDPKETGAHANRVAGYSVEIYENWAKQKKVPDRIINSNRDILMLAAMLHDVGKVGISDMILKKAGKLTEEEFAIMKQHTYIGSKLFISGISELDQACAIIALNHHEKWDGTGYPGHIDINTGKPILGYEDARGNARPKKGEEIPLFGRIVALADVFDALCSSRSYKEAWSDEKALELIKNESNKHFDPELVKAFLDCYDVIISIRDKYRNQI